MRSIDIYLRQKIHDLTIYLKELPIRHDIGIRNSMILLNSTVYLLLGKLIYPERNRLVLSTAKTPIHEAVFEKARDVMILDSSAGTHVQFSYGALEDKAILKTGVVAAVPEKYAGGSNRIVLRTSSAGADVTSPIRVNLAYILSSHIGNGWYVSKYTNITHTGVLESSLNDQKISFADDIHVSKILRIGVNARLARYRLLGEMDDLTLADFDDMELQDVDLVELV